VPAGVAATSPFSVEFWIYSGRYSGDGDLSQTVWSTDSGEVGITFGGLLYFSTSTGTVTTDDQWAFDNALHHVVATKNGSTIKIYVDGDEVATTTTGTVGFLSLANPYIFASQAGVFGTGAFYPPWGNLITEIAIYHSTLSAARVLAHYNAGVSPWTGDDTGARAQRYLDEVAWPSARYDIDTGQNTLGLAKLGGKSAAELLRGAESSEQGQTFVDHRNGGKVRVVERHSRLLSSRSINSQYTFSDDGTDGTAYRYETIELVYDDRDIVNQVDVTWQEGQESVSDSSSQTTYGLRKLAIETELPTSQNANDLGNWVLNRYKDPAIRCKSLTLAPGRRSDGTWLPALDLQINDRITVRVLPQNSGSAITKTLLVEGIEHDYTGLDWRTTLYTTETDANDYWIWGVSTWGTSTRWGY
jgi:hypothetical protein